MSNWRAGSKKSKQGSQGEREWEITEHYKWSRYFVKGFTCLIELNKLI